MSTRVRPRQAYYLHRLAHTLCLVPTLPLRPVYILASGTTFMVFMLCLLRPLMAQLAHRGSMPLVTSFSGAAAVVVFCALLAGAAMDAIGLNLVFGAFVFGLAVLREGGVAVRAGETVVPLLTGLMLPLYFANSGQDDGRLTRMTKKMMGVNRNAR